MPTSALVTSDVIYKKPAGQYTYIHTYHAACGCEMKEVTQGKVVVDFCPQCFAIDMQAVNALQAALTWIARGLDKLPFNYDEDVELNAYQDGDDPRTRPPVPYKAVRLWSFSYHVEVASNEDFGDGEVNEDEGDREVLVALMPEGTYFVEPNHYPICRDAPEGNALCWFYTSDGKCPEHGDVTTIPDEDD